MQKESNSSQTFTDWRQVLDEKQVQRSLTRIAHEILEKNPTLENLAIVGIRTRGEFIGKRICETIKKIEGKDVDFGVVDITLYRDDLFRTDDQPVVRETDLPFNIDDKVLVLTDDVLFTGRTVRSALDAVMDFGRPKKVQLAVLIDRGHRELPIRPDFVGKSIPTAANEMVRVRIKECDDKEGVFVRTVSDSEA